MSWTSVINISCLKYLQPSRPSNCKLVHILYNLPKQHIKKYQKVPNSKNLPKKSPTFHPIIKKNQHKSQKQQGRNFKDQPRLNAKITEMMIGRVHLIIKNKMMIMYQFKAYFLK